MSVEIVEKDGARYALLPYEEYRQLLEDLEDARDVALAEAFQARVQRGEEELIPADIAHRLIDGEHPVKVWREYRRLTQRALAEEVGISGNYLSQIERGHRGGRVDVLQALAKALGVELADLVVES